MPTRAGPGAGGPLHPHNCPMPLQVTQAGEGRTGQALGSPPHPSASGCLRPAPPMQEGSRTHTPPTAPWTSAVRPETVIYTGPLQGPGAQLWVEGSGVPGGYGRAPPAPQSPHRPPTDAGDGLFPRDTRPQVNTHLSSSARALGPRQEHCGWDDPHASHRPLRAPGTQSAPPHPEQHQTGPAASQGHPRGQPLPRPSSLLLTLPRAQLCGWEGAETAVGTVLTSQPSSVRDWGLASLGVHLAPAGGLAGWLMPGVGARRAVIGGHVGRVGGRSWPRHGPLLGHPSGSREVFPVGAAVWVGWGRGASQQSGSGGQSQVCTCPRWHRWSKSPGPWAEPSPAQAPCSMPPPS